MYDMGPAGLTFYVQHSLCFTRSLLQAVKSACMRFYGVWQQDLSLYNGMSAVRQAQQEDT